MDERTESRALALAAIALTLFGIFAPYKWHDMPNWATNSALILALLCALWAAFIWLPSPAKGLKKSMAALLIAGGTCALITGIVMYFDPSLVKPEYDFPWVYATASYQDGKLQKITASIGAQGTARQHNVLIHFTALTKDKPMKGAGQMPLLSFIDPGSANTPWQLDLGNYFITMRTDVGMFRESLSLTIENDQIRQHIRILNDADEVVYEADIP